MFGIGYQELIVVLAILLLFFGGRKLPELSRSIGKSIRELRHGLKDDEEEKTVSDKKTESTKS